MEKIKSLIKEADSFSSVEKIDGHLPGEGEYGVTVYFTTEEAAREFYGELAMISARP